MSCVDAAETGRRIRRAREARGWRRQDLADALTRQRGGRRVGVRSIGRWERGETLPRNAGGALEQVLKISLNGPDDEDDPTEQAIMALDAPERLRLDWVDQFRRAKREPARRTALPPAQ